MKKYCVTFKLFGHNIGLIRRGSNVHAIMVLAGIFGMALLGYATLCLWVGIGNTL